MSTRLALLVALLSLSACSFSLDHPDSTVTIDLKGPSSKLELFPGSRLFDIEPPSDSSGFDCLVVNVVGPGIVPAYGPEAQVGFLDSLYQGHSCMYPGVSAIVPNSGNSHVSLRVPSGPKRVVQVGGVMKGLSDMCQKTQIVPPSSGVGLAFFELGRTIVDLFRDTGVQIEETYNQATAAQRAQRLMTCNVADPSVYRDLIMGTPGILSYWPLSETSGTTAADLEVGTVGTALGNMTLTTYTSTDGPPGTGLSGMHAGQNGIAVNAGASFGTGDFSVEFWTRYSAPCHLGSGALFTMRHSGAAIVQFKCNASDHVLFTVQDNSGPSATATSFDDINNGDWNHVVGVKHGSTIDLYVNAGTPSAGIGSVPNSIDFTTAPHTYVGQDTAAFQDGDYAQVAIYTTALSQSDVTDHLTTGD